MNVAVLDDEPEDVRLLAGYLERFQSEYEVPMQIHTFYGSIDFLEEFAGEYDIIFLDIKMPDSDGLTVAREIRRRDPAVAIIFVTIMAQYAIQGYEVNAIDFMVKPVGYFNFAEKLEKAIRFNQARGNKDILLMGEDGVVRLTASQLLYAEKDKNDLIYHTTVGVFQKRGSMKALKESLQGLPFAECTSGCLVNLTRVQRIGKESVFLPDAELPLSRRMKKDFTQRYIEYIGGGL